MGSRLGAGFGIFKGGSGGGGGGTVTSLTTTGTSGASTLIGGVLNIPIYGGGGGGIYGGSGSLTAATTVSQGSNTLEFNIDNQGVNPFNILSLTETGGGSIIHTIGFNGSAKILLNGLLTADISLDTSGSSYINTGFNFGVGTTTPALRLSVEGTAGVGGLADFSSATGRVVVIKDYLNHAVMDFSNSTAPTTILGRFYTGGDSWFNTVGNFGFGTITPTEKLEVVGNVKITGGIDVDSSTFLVDGTTHAFSLGYLATPETSIPDAVTIGYQANTLGSGRSIAIGRAASAVATGVASNIAIGYQAKAPSGDNVISIGDQSGSTITSNGNQTILMGYLAGNQTATIGTQTIAIGDQTDATGIQATLLGSQAEAAANWAIAIGRQAKANHLNGIAIGLRAETGTGTTRAYVIASGTTGTVNSVSDSLAVGFNEATPRFLFAKTADSYLNGSGNVGIGTTTPNASALLDVSSTTKGFLPPVMTTTEMNAIGSPASGLMIFDRVTSQWMGYDGSSWVIIG